MNVGALTKEDPILLVYKRPWWQVGLICLLGLSGVIQLILIGVNHENPLQEAKVIELGDPILAVFMASAAYALRSYRITKRQIWHSNLWLVLLAALGVTFNFFWNGQPNYIEAGLFYQVHFAQVAVFTALILGVVPRLLEVRGQAIAKAVAGGAIVIYVLSLLAH